MENAKLPLSLIRKFQRLYETARRELCAGIALDQMPVTMAYVPWTKWRNIYEAEKGLRRGTIFQDLDKPFRGIGGCQNGR